MLSEGCSAIKAQASVQWDLSKRLRELETQPGKAPLEFPQLLLLLETLHFLTPRSKVLWASALQVLGATLVLTVVILTKQVTVCLQSSLFTSKERPQCTWKYYFFAGTSIF